MEEQEVQALKVKFLTGMQSNPLLNKLLETKGFESPTIQSYWHNFIAQQKLPKTASDFDEFLKETGADVQHEEV